MNSKVDMRARNNRQSFFGRRCDAIMLSRCYTTCKPEITSLLEARKWLWKWLRK